MKRLIVGSGKVASIIRKDDDVILPRTTLDITSRYPEIARKLSEFASEGQTIVINTAAKINLEWCEENKDEAYAVNVDGAVNLANAVESLRSVGKDVKLVHIGSGCIFDGGESGKEYTETDDPSPAAWYAETKAMADKLVLQTSPSALVLRPRQLVSAVPWATNMLTKFLERSSGKYIDVPNSVTCIEDFGSMMDFLVRMNKSGVWNCANDGTVSPYWIAERLKQKIKPDMVVEKIAYDDYVKTLSVKRVNTVLSIDKLMLASYMPRSAIDAVNWCIDNYGKVR